MPGRWHVYGRNYWQFASGYPRPYQGGYPKIQDIRLIYNGVRLSRRFREARRELHLDLRASVGMMVANLIRHSITI